MNTSNKEIDIFELYQRILSFFKRRWLLILILTVIGAFVGFAKAKMGHSEYQGSLVISSDVLSKNDLYEKIIPLDVQGLRPSNQRFVYLLNVEPELFKEITVFEIDTVSLKNQLIIEYQHKDSLKVLEIANAFYDFYHSQSDFMDMYNSEIETYKKYLNFINEEISDLNNYQKKVLESSRASEVILMNLSGCSEEIMSLYEKRFNYQKKIDRSKIVTVSYNSAFSVPKTSLLKTMILWGFISAFLAFVIALILELDRETKKRIQ